METNIHYSIVGAFVIALVSAVVFAVIWLSSGFSFEHYTKYMIQSTESISGLNIDSPVEFNGVNVGSVEQVELNPNNPQLVEVILNIRSNTPVTQGTVATLTSKGITGITFVALKDKSTDLRPLIAKPGQKYRVITMTPSLFVRIDTALSRLSMNLREVSQSIQSVLDKQNQQSIKNILINVDHLTRVLAENSGKLTSLIDNSEKMFKQMGPLLHSSASTMRMIETQTLPQAYQLLSNLNSVAQNLSQVSVQLKDNPSILIRGPAAPILGPGETK